MLGELKKAEAERQYGTQAYDAFKNTQSSALITLGKYLLVKFGQKVGLTEDESKPWETLPESQQWLGRCLLHAFVRSNIIDALQG